MSTFARAYAETCAIDGIIFKFASPAADHRQAVINRLRATLQGMHSLSQKDQDRCFKVHIFNMSADRSAAVVKLELYGAWCKLAPMLPAGWLAMLHGAHFKSYTFSVGDPEGDTLRDAIYNSSGGQQTTIFNERTNDHPTKGSGKGWRVGDRKADYHFVHYQRGRGQRPGLEVRVQDRPVARVAKEMLQMSVDAGLPDKGAWITTLGKLAFLAAERLERDFTLKNVAPHAFFSGFTDNPYLEVERVEYFSLTNALPYTFDFTSGEIIDGHAQAAD